MGKAKKWIGLVELSRSPRDDDQAKYGRGLQKLTEMERLAFVHGVVRVRSLEYVCAVTGTKTKTQAKALIADAKKKLG